ncbi:hypothetical protein OIE50_03275 [Streptomyces canus]|uniref:hypothetical protein n=1 Tax=Streptomyces canus TaxID=58343 RepID=UPI003244C56D
MPRNERLNCPGFVDRYKRAVTAYQDQLAEERRQREDAKRRQAIKAVSRLARLTSRYGAAPTVQRRIGCRAACSSRA